MSEFVYKGEKRPYEIMENGSVWNMPATHCVFCKHCNDVIYDHSNGPYMFFCDKDLEITKGEYKFSCGSFEDSGYLFDEEDYKEKMQLRKDMWAKHKHLLETDPEYKAEYDKYIEETMNAILYGLDSGERN